MALLMKMLIITDIRAGIDGWMGRWNCWYGLRKSPRFVENKLGSAVTVDVSGVHPTGTGFSNLNTGAFIIISNI